jgi:glycosyltransferase involved in cell wall biosynthesis
VIHAYEDGAASSFQRAKELGIRRSYELPIAHWKTVRLLLSEEAERYPEWEPTLESTREPEEKLLRKEKELRLASSIICPSDFVRQSIPKEIRDKTPCKISPFGSPSSIQVDAKPKDLKRGPFKVLFVGSMSQRKGLADLFKAMRILKGEEVRLSILGQPSMPMEFYRKQFSDFIYFPPTSNQEVTRIMQDHDALILPSIIEGRALVQQEALSCGLPIITTPNAGGADLIEEGMTGHLVPIRSPEIIAEKIISLADNKDCLNDLKIRCQQKAKTYTWQSYARKIIDMHS